MALLPPFIRASRMRSTPTRPAAGAPADEVLLDAPDDRLGPALVAAGRGEFEPAAALLALTRATADWEHRDRYVVRLAAFARSRGEWFETWRAADPHDPDGLLVEAQLAVDHAWTSPARAELLRGVSPLITAAAQLDARDPVPWRVALTHARGARAGHKYFGELWEAAVRRAPHHYGCHAAALHYLAASWQGSHRECFDFAERAAQDAPADSLVQALPAHAAFGYLSDGCGAEVARERLDAAADRAVAFSARFAAASPWPAEARNELMYVLVRLGRWSDALAQLDLIGPYVTSFPWDRLAADPLAHFLHVRDQIRAATATGAPGVRTGAWGGRTGRARSVDH
ncbi:hypothetical protein [Streptomyces mangrovisoli]|uniref:DUF4034 domain-containing protein n=1 Tax=Streptomyces mangrovisoli TaxID=1428628 RepID=A0A1J4P6L0_9ACTN|nr:hypothetical protein [Streptomyces mangrovisoli]OIJ69125.1 hypothetical protein WN71_004920 [Streptomyces mangrovisoli]